MQGDARPRDGDALWALLERSVAPAFLIDDGRRYVDANQAACLLMRLPRSDIVDLRVDDVVAPSRLRDLPARWARLMERGTLSGHGAIVPPGPHEVEVDFRLTASVRPGRHLAILSLPHVARERRAADSPLTHREREVLTLLSLGFRGREIAQTLSIAAPTVQTHVRNAMKRLGARTRTHAVVLALTRGEIWP